MLLGLWDEEEGVLNIRRPNGQEYRVRNSAIAAGSHKVFGVETVGKEVHVLTGPGWRPRKEAYLAHVPHATSSARLVSVADKLHNATAILRDYRRLHEGLRERFNGGKDGTLWYYRSLVEAYKAAGPHPILDELDRVVSELQAEVSRQTSPAGER